MGLIENGQRVDAGVDPGIPHSRDGGVFRDREELDMLAGRVLFLLLCGPLPIGDQLTKRVGVIIGITMFVA